MEAINLQSSQHMDDQLRIPILFVENTWISRNSGQKVHLPSYNT